MSVSKEGHRDKHSHRDMWQFSDKERVWIVLLPPTGIFLPSTSGKFQIVVHPCYLCSAWMKYSCDFFSLHSSAVRQYCGCWTHDTGLTTHCILYTHWISIGGSKSVATTMWWIKYPSFTSLVHNSILMLMKSQVTQMLNCNTFRFSSIWNIYVLKFDFKFPFLLYMHSNVLWKPDENNYYPKCIHGVYFFHALLY